MSFESYWERLCSHPKNEGLKNSARMTITVESLRASLRRAFEAGRREGVNEGLNSKSVFEELFGRLYE